MRLLIKQRVFSWTDSYDVYDENENPKYFVKAEFFSLGHQLHVYDDCCTIFVAKHPVTKPNLAVIKRHEENLKDCIDEMMQRALDTEELIVVEAQ